MNNRTRTQHLHIMMNSEETRMVREIARRTGLSASDAVRKMIREHAAQLRLWATTARARARAAKEQRT